MNDTKQEILDIVAHRGHFDLIPDLFTTHGQAVDELVELGLIEPYSNICGYNRYNSCYTYIEKGNPRNLAWTKSGNHWIALTPSKHSLVG